MSTKTGECISGGRLAELTMQVISKQIQALFEGWDAGNGSPISVERAASRKNSRFWY